MDCLTPFDQEVTEPGATIVSSLFPNDDNSSKTCQLTIRFSGNQRVSLIFEKFWVSSPLDSSCSNDYLEVRDGDSLGSGLIGSRLCGSMVPGEMESTGNSMHLLFHRKNNANHNHFQVTAEIGKFKRSLWPRAFC